jgi:uncharacterized protein YjbI with pentapeptide repeats
MTKGRRSAPTGQAVPAQSSAEFAAKAQNLQALRDAVVDSAGVGAGLWFSYLFVLFYFLIAVGSVTHRDLLLESPIKLPFLNIELPLVGFFVLGPLLFLIVHAYVLLHFVLLAGKAGIFHDELEKQIADPSTRARLRRQLPSNIFVQILAGPREVRSGIFGFMLRLVAWISLLAGPLALLVFFQLQFLPYHHGGATWWHRLAVLADLTLLWMLWPSVARGKTTWITLRDFRRRNVVASALASLVPLLLVLDIATFPGDWPLEKLPEVRFVPIKWPARSDQGNVGDDVKQQATGTGKAPLFTALMQSIENEAKQFLESVQLIEWTSLHGLLVAGKIDPVSRKPVSLWSNRLVLSYVDVIDSAKFDTEDKINAVRETLLLRGRRLEGAVFVGAKLRKVDFTAAQLQDADFTEADVRDAKFECATEGDANHPFSYGPCANLQRASLYFARIQGASLNEAQLQGALLTGAWLQGASLGSAHLERAELKGAKLQGAILIGAQLQGAVLSNAGLEAAALDSAEFQGAWLDGARLQGASLSMTNLQGALLEGAQFQGALLKHVSVWRADPRQIKGRPILVPPLVYDQKCDKYSHCKSFVELERLIEEQHLHKSRDLEEKYMLRTAILDPARVYKDDKAISDAWDNLEKSSAWSQDDEKMLAETMQRIGCNAEGAPYVIRILMSDLEFRPGSRFGPNSIFPTQVVAKFLDEKQCDGARALSEADKVRLNRIRRSLLPPTSASAGPEE